MLLCAGFMLPVPSMHPWFEWIHYINPIYYAFEILIANEFHGRDFPCSSFVPSYADMSGDSFSCSSAGSVAGELTVNGDRYRWLNYRYKFSHVYRNLGILLAFLIAFMIIYFVASELNSSTASTAEALVFRRGHEPAHLHRSYKKTKSDVESTEESPVRQPISEKVEKRECLPFNRRRTYSPGEMYAMILRSRANLGGFWIMLRAGSSQGH